MAYEPNRSIEFKIKVDGFWDIDDLLKLSESMAESYGYFYALAVTDQEIARELHNLVQKKFWTGDLETHRFGKFLYEKIPHSQGLKVKSLVYHSPGDFTLTGILDVLVLIAKTVKNFAEAASNVTSTLEKIDAFFQKRKNYIKPKKKIPLDNDAENSLEEARLIVFELGELFGFDYTTCETVIAISGNPISAVKLLTAIARETRKLSNMQSDGLLELPYLEGRTNIGRPMANLEPPGVKVVRKPNRKKFT